MKITRDQKVNLFLTVTLSLLIVFITQKIKVCKHQIKKELADKQSNSFFSFIKSFQTPSRQNMPTIIYLDILNSWSEGVK